MPFIKRISRMNKYVYFGFRSISQPYRASCLQNIYHGNPVYYCTYKNQFNTYTGTLIKEDVRIQERNLSVSKSITAQPSLRNQKSVFEACPKGLLISIYDIVNRELKLSNTMNKTYSVNEKGNWTCKINISWPEHLEFEESAKNKKQAHKLAASKCLRWLEENNKLRHGKPVLYTIQEMKNITNKLVQVKVDPNFVTKMGDLVQLYTDVKLYMGKQAIETEETPEENDQSGLPKHQNIGNQKTISDFYRRDRELKGRLVSRAVPQKALPIAAFKTEILKKLELHRKLLIRGGTGCGKTTQVPQFIMDHFISKGQATACNMIISQPRRISAIANARRIAEERNEIVGDVVGYAVKLARSLPWTPGGMLFCTTGVLLLILQRSPSLQNYTHVILDEAHERNVETDMLLVLLKRALDLNPQLKLIVMSATIDSDLFQKYLDCPVVEVPGKMYPVQMNFLEDIQELGIKTRERSVYDLNDTIMVDYRGICDLVNRIVETTEEGAILCFLPGWANIAKLRGYLETGLNANVIMVAPVHSKLSHLDQEKVFEHAPYGRRKIILATDIAENGITINDVTHVVDCAIRNEQRWDMSKNIFSISSRWISKANVLQRKGRAGRVRPGVSYHFITKEQYNGLDEYPIPEILRIPLDRIVLLAKIHSSEKAATFFSNTPQAPSREALESAIDALQRIGTLDENENLTGLGKKISKFWLFPTMGKSIVLSSILKCVQPILTIISMYSIESEIFARSLEDKSMNRVLKKKYHPSSDHLAISWLYTQWHQYSKQYDTLADQFCYTNSIMPTRIQYLKKVIDLNAGGVVSSFLARSAKECVDPGNDINAFANIDELVKGVLLAGTDQLLYQPGYARKRGRLVESFDTLQSEGNIRTLVSTESVNYKRKSWPSPYLTYLIRTFNTDQRMALVRETSMISPLTLILFTQSTIVIEKSMENHGVKQCVLRINNKTPVKLICDAEVAETLLRFRQVFWDVVNYLAGLEYSAILFDHDLDQVKEFRDKVLKLVVKMLLESSTELDSPDIASNVDPKLEG